MRSGEDLDMTLVVAHIDSVATHSVVDRDALSRLTAQNPARGCLELWVGLST